MKILYSIVCLSIASLSFSSQEKPTSLQVIQSQPFQESLKKSISILRIATDRQLLEKIVENPCILPEKIRRPALKARRAQAILNFHEFNPYLDPDYKFGLENTVTLQSLIAARQYQNHLKDEFDKIQDEQLMMRSNAIIPENSSITSNATTKIDAAFKNSKDSDIISELSASERRSNSISSEPSDTIASILNAQKKQRFALQLKQQSDQTYEKQSQLKEIIQLAQKTTDNSCNNAQAIINKIMKNVTLQAEKEDTQLKKENKKNQKIFNAQLQKVLEENRINQQKLKELERRSQQSLSDKARKAFEKEQEQQLLQEAKYKQNIQNLQDLIPNIARTSKTSEEFKEKTSAIVVEKLKIIITEKNMKQNIADRVICNSALHLSEISFNQCLQISPHFDGQRLLDEVVNPTCDQDMLNSFKNSAWAHHLNLSDQNLQYILGLKKLVFVGALYLQYKNHAVTNQKTES